MGTVRNHAVVLLVCGLLVWTAGCGREDSDAGPQSVSNTELEITLSEVPEGLVVAVNQGRELVLEPSKEGEGGRIRFEVGPETEGVNLVAAVKEHEAGVAAATGGNYLGTTELMSHLGSAFISRGQFDLDAEPLEEARVFVIHPAGDRLLTLVYSYPANTSDASQRAQALLGVLGNIEVGNQ